MSLSDDTRNWKNWVSLAARLILGIALIWAAATKIGNLDSSVHSVAAYQILPYSVAQVVGYAMPFAELGLGLLLVVGLFTRVMGGLGALMMLAFIIAIASVWIRKIAIDCGCYGPGGPIDWETAKAAYPWEILRDIGLMACGIWLVFAKKYFLAIDTILFRPVEEILARQNKRRGRR